MSVTSIKLSISIDPNNIFWRQDVPKVVDNGPEFPNLLLIWFEVYNLYFFYYLYYSQAHHLMTTYAGLFSPNQLIGNFFLCLLYDILTSLEEK